MNKLKMIFFGLLLMASTTILGQIGIGTVNVAPSAILELDATDKALIIPRVANTAAITNPVNGMLIFDLSSLCIRGYEDGKWTGCLYPGLNEVLVQIGYEGDIPNTIPSIVTVEQLQSVPGVIGVNPTSEDAYQSYIDANPNLFSTPATIEEVNAMIAAVTSNGTALVDSYICSTASVGTMTEGQPVTGVTQTITAMVIIAGTYNLSMTTNGITFAASGTFTSTGSQNIVLTATGTPTINGSFSFTLNTTPNCSFSRVVGLDPSSNGSSTLTFTTCAAESVGAMTPGVPVTNVSQTISVNVTQVGSYSISTSANGVVFAASGNVTSTGVQNITLTATGTPITQGVFNYVLNTTPNCSFSRTVITLPIGFVFEKPQRPQTTYPSIYDTDYLPYSLPTGPASLVTPVAADGIADPTINIQGIITASNRNVGLRYSDTSSSGVVKNVPAYSTTVNIPAIYTEDGISRNVTFSWVAFSYTTPVIDGQIIARINAIGGNINLKKLDIHNSIGADGAGILLNTFHYPSNNNGNSKTHPLLIAAGIPDRNIADVNHKYFYSTVTSTTGRVWLKTNLGTFFNNIDKFTYSPHNQDVSYYDYRQKGNLFQWGRSADNHEYIEWSNNADGGEFGTRPTTFIQSVTDSPGNSNYIAQANINIGDWRAPANDNLWQGVDGINNPCPYGFRLPTVAEFQAEIDEYNLTNLDSTYSSILQLGTTGYSPATSSSTSDSHISGVGSYWTSTISGVQSSYLSITTTSIIFENSARASGRAVRCIKN